MSTGKDGKTTGWDKAAVITQAVAAVAIPISLVALVLGVRQFKQQQKTAADQALNQQYQATLNNYINDISTLTIFHNLSHPPPGSPVRAIALARTDTAIRNLDGPRRGILLRYLWEAGLIRRPRPVVYLHKVNMNRAVLANAYLYGADLGTDYLIGADLQATDLHGANLKWANLDGAKLIRADLSCYSGNQINYSAVAPGAPRIAAMLAHEHLKSITCADLANATLNGANLYHANLIGANLTGASLAGAQLTGATYNAEPIVFAGVGGKPLTIPRTQWPPSAHHTVAREAFCIDC